MQNKRTCLLKKCYYKVREFCLKNQMFISYGIIDIFEEKKDNRRTHRQCEKSGNCHYLNKIDILDNGNGNVNKVMV